MSENILIYKITRSEIDPVNLDVPDFDAITTTLPSGLYTTFRTYAGRTKVIGLRSHLERLYLPAKAHGIVPTVRRQDDFRHILADLLLRVDIQFTLQKLKKDIADFRDYQIAHEKSPRTVHGIAFSGSSHEVSMTMMKIQPKETDAQAQTKILSELQADVDTYLRTIMLIISANSDKTRFKLRGAV